LETQCEILAKNKKPPPFIRKAVSFSISPTWARISKFITLISRIENTRRDYMHSALLEVYDALGVSITEIVQKKIS
jgi:hypothetical protein